MKINKAWLGTGLFIVVFSLAFTLSAQAQIGVYNPTSGTSDDTSLPTCGSWANKNYVNFLDSVDSGSHGFGRRILNGEFTPPASALSDEKNIYRQSVRNETQFCGNSIGGFYEDGVYLDLSTFGILKKVTRDASGKITGALSYQPGGAKDNLSWTWMCCKDILVGNILKTECVSCAAKRISPSCGLAIGTCSNGEVYIPSTENPKGSGIFTWACKSYDTLLGEDQVISCGIDTKGTGCGTLNNTIISEEEALSGGGWSGSPCPTGSTMRNNVIRPTSNPYTVPTSILLSDGTIIQQPQYCDQTTMAWECYNPTNGVVSSCASKCPESNNDSPGITQPNTGNTGTGSYASSTSNNSSLQTIFNQILSILSQITSALAKL